MNVKSICLLGSYWFLGDSYFLYKLAKKVYTGAFGRGYPVRAPIYPNPGIIIEGFPHSGNNFFRTNIMSDFDSKTCSFHRTWAVKRALAHGMPTAVVIRDPLEVAKSWHYRSISSQDGVLPIWVVICCWMKYHNNLWKFRDRVLLVTLKDLNDRFPDIRRKVLQLASVPMNIIPDFSSANRFTGQRFPIRLNSWDNFFLRRAQSIYGRYERLSQLAEATPMDLPAGARLARQEAC